MVILAAVCHAIHLFGAMAPAVFKAWGIHSAADIGDMVMRLIAADILVGDGTERLRSFTRDIHVSMNMALRRHENRLASNYEVSR